MPTFTKKPEVVDARQFTGGPKSGKDIVRWVSANEANAQWETCQTALLENGKLVQKTTLDTVKIRNSHLGISETLFVHPGSWVIRHQDGHFATMLNEDFQEGYSQA